MNYMLKKSIRKIEEIFISNIRKKVSNIEKKTSENGNKNTKPQNKSVFKKIFPVLMRFFLKNDRNREK